MKTILPLLLGFAMLPATNFAQELPSNAPGATPVEPEGLELGRSLLVSEAAKGGATDVAQPAGEPVALTEAGDASRRGRWRFAPHFRAKGTYDDNIFIQPKSKVADYIGTLEPGLALGFWDSNEARERFLERQRSAALIEHSDGSFVVADYTATLLGFAKTTSQNALEHDGKLDAQWQRRKLTLGASIHAESKSETNTDVGNRVRRKTVTAAFTSSYQISDKTRFGFAIYHRTNEPENYLRTVEWSGEGSLDYAISPSTRFGFGFTAGRVQVERSADQTFQRALARMDYSLSEKVEVEFRGGVEFRQSGGRVGDQTNPVFDLRADWTPAPGTRIGLEATRHVEPSWERPDQDYTLTGVALSFRQAIRGGLHFSVEGGYHVAEYSRTLPGEVRTDRYFFIRPGLLYNFATWGNAGVTYEHRRNESDRPSESFRDNQISVEVGVTY